MNGRLQLLWVLCFVPMSAAVTANRDSREKSRPPTVTNTSAEAQIGPVSTHLIPQSCGGTRDCIAGSFHRGTGFCLCNATHHPDDDCTMADFEVRLQLMNSNADQGVVEVRIDGQWGQICDDYWNHKDATVVCRHLGLPSQHVKMWTRTNFSEPRSMYLFALGCDGTEDNLLRCPFRYGVGCCGNGFARFDPVVHCRCAQDMSA